jgi:hypothetical protein
MKEESGDILIMKPNINVVNAVGFHDIVNTQLGQPVG